MITYAQLPFNPNRLGEVWPPSAPRVARVNDDDDDEILINSRYNNKNNNNLTLR